MSGEDPARIQRFIANANKRITTNSKLELPKDTGKSIPPEGLSWLYQYGLNDAEIEKYGIGWSEKYQRVILPVFQEDNLIFWQGRYLGSNKKIPKYLNQKLAKRNQDTFFDIRIAKNKEIVIVEDILSAIKVGRQYNVTALLHSTITDSIFLRVKNFNPIYVWLDPDKVFYTIDIINRMRLIGINAKRIMSEKDPKYYSDYDINKIISCNN